MRIEQLLYLQKATQLGSISAAANNLYLSPQTLAAALKSLEKELNHTLFITSRHGISLTPQGEIVLKTANKILAQIDEMKSALDDCSLIFPEPENIFIQIAPVIEEYLFPDIFQTLINHYPHIAISMETHMPLDIIDDIKNANSHLGILGIQYSLLDKLGLTAVLSNELTFVPLFQYKFSVAVSIQHPLAHYKSLSVKTFMKYPIVFQTNANLAEDLNYQWLKLYGNPIIKSVVSSNKLYLECIKSGAAIGFFPSPQYGQLNIPLDDAIKLIPLNEQDAQHIVGYLYNNTRPVTPAMQIIMEELQKYSLNNCFTSAK